MIIISINGCESITYEYLDGKWCADEAQKIAGSPYDIELDSPLWLDDTLSELKDRDFQRVNDPRELIITEIIAL